MRVEPKEVVIVFAFCFVAIFIISFSKISTEVGYGDNAFLIQLSENIARDGSTTSNVVQAIKDFLASGLQSAEAEEFKKYDFGYIIDPQDGNVFKYHTYFILFLIVPFVKIFGANVVLNILHVSSFIVLILAIYLFLRDRGIGIVPALIFCFYISTHPALAQSITGQLYVERYFIGFAGLFIFFLTREKKNHPLIIILGVLCSLISERSGLAIGVFIISWMIVNWQTNESPFRESTMVLGFFFCVFSIILTKLYLKNYYSPNFLPFSSQTLAQMLSNVEFWNGLAMFLILNLIIYGLVAAFEWRFFLPSVLVMLPNMIGNIGGAEKTGFLTHYHSLYIPFLAFALAFGFVRCYAYVKNNHLKISLVAGIALFALIGMNLYPYDMSDIKLLKNPLHGYAVLKYVSPNVLSKRSITKRLREFVENSIPKNVVVSTPERFMPLLFESRNLYFYPLGMDVADFVVLNIKIDENGHRIYSGAYSVMGKNATKEINFILQERLLAAGYDLEHPKVLKNAAILKRKKF